MKTGKVIIRSFLSCITILCLFFPSVVCANTSATSSSVQSNEFSPDKAIDGNFQTRWSSQFSDPQWLNLDLGAEITVYKVNLYWEAAYAKAYEIQVSSDGNSWNAVYSTTNCAGGNEEISFTPVSARYIRIYATQRATEWGYSLFEVEVNTNLKNLISAVASSIENNDPNLAAAKAIDGNPATRWSSVSSDPQWIYLDFGTSQTFNAIILNWEAAYGKTYEIQSSDDALIWNTLYRQTNFNGGKDIIGVGNQAARYVRMYGIERATPWGYSLYEFKAEFRDDGQVPSAPMGFSAVADDTVVFLNWKTNTETDIYGYNIYRGTTMGGPYTKLNERPTSLLTYRDKAVTNATAYYYIIKAVDFAGNESPVSNEITVTPQISSRNFFSIPSCAWQRYIGDIPAATESTCPDRGIAVGGFGAGCFM